MKRIITNRTSNPAHLFQAIAAAEFFSNHDQIDGSAPGRHATEILSLPFREEPRLRGLIKQQAWKLARCRKDPVVLQDWSQSNLTVRSLRFTGVRGVLRSLGVPEFLLFFSVVNSPFDSFYFGKRFVPDTGSWFISVTPTSRPRLLATLVRAFLHVSRRLPLVRPLRMTQPEALFSLEYKGITFGDLLVAHGLRYDRRAGGDPSRLRGVRRLAIQAVVQIETAMSIHITDHDVFLGDEHTYLHWVYPRVFSRRGVPSIGFIDGTLMSFPNDADLIEARTTLPRRPISELERQKAKELLRVRTTHLTHDKRFGSSSETLVRKVLGLGQDQFVSTLSETSEPSFVLLLHSFHDGLYFYGRDDFSGVFDWAQYLIQTIAGDLDKKVLIKLHPNADYSRTHFRYSTDVHALRRLVSSSATLTNVSFVDPYVRLSDFKSKESLCFVTKHGSAAPELAFLGLRCITSSASPWRDAYSFSHVAQSKKELKIALKLAAQGRWDDLFPPSPRRQDEAVLFAALEKRRLDRRLDLRYCKEHDLPSSPSPHAIHQLSLHLRSMQGFLASALVGG